MKLQNFVLNLGLLFCVCNLFGQDIDIDMIYELPADIQSNIVLVVTNTQPCPKEYTNVLSNTNLFTLDEQILFKNFSLKHKNVTTNDDKISSENFRAKSGDGYDVYFNGGSIERFLQFKGGVVNGLYVNFKDDHCMSWMHVENGKAIGKWYEWDDAGNLKLEAEFKKPSNFMEQFKFNPPR
ncbi:MAG: hypothetical protein ACLP2Y_10745 [Limisphaerales bacterium]